MFSAFARAAEAAKASGNEYFTVIENQQPLRLALKVAAGGWLAYKLVPYMMQYGDKIHSHTIVD